jgi:protein NirF
LVDAPGQRFVCSLFDTGEIWLIDAKNPKQPKIKKFTEIGKQPYDALLTPDGRYYLAGLFGEPGLALLDLWNIDTGIKKILSNYGKHQAKLPVYKMPHLEGWAIAGNLMFIPAVGQHEVLVVNTENWQLIKQIPVAGQPVFVMARPDGRQIWVNFALPDNHQLQVIDVKNMGLLKTLSPGKAVLHMEFTPRGESVWISVRDENKIIIYNTDNFEVEKSLPANKPSGIFFTSRANQIGL